MNAVNNKILIPRVDLRRCTGCGMCEQICPTHAVSVRNGTAAIVRPDACSFCELCESSCPTGAIGRPFEIAFAPRIAPSTRPGPRNNDW